MMGMEMGIEMGMGMEMMGTEMGTEMGMGMEMGVEMGKHKNNPRAHLCHCRRRQSPEEPMGSGTGWGWKNPLLLVPWGSLAMGTHI